MKGKVDCNLINTIARDKFEKECSEFFQIDTQSLITLFSNTLLFTFSRITNPVSALFRWTIFDSFEI